MKNFIASVICLFISLFVNSALADCNFTDGAFTTHAFQAGTVVINRDVSVGTVVYQSTTSLDAIGSHFAISCGPEGIGYITTGTMSGSVLSGNIYRTNIPGIGLRVSVSKSTGFLFPAALTPLPFSYTWTSTTSYTGTGNGYLTVELIKTGSVLSSGQLDYTANNYLSISGNGSSMNIASLHVTGYVNNVACSVTTTDIEVPLADVLGASLTGVGVTAKRKDFNLGLNCDAGTRINVTMAGLQHSDTSATGVLQLSNPLSASTATGVGIQMLYNNSPMPLNTNLVLKTSSGGVETFPFSAQYYQTRSSVTTGTANATATLNITYQ